MKTEVTPCLPGGNPSRRRFRKPFSLGAPQALIAPLEGILDAVRALTGAPRAAIFAVEGRDVTLVANRGEGAPPSSRLAARALAEGAVLAEGGQIAMPMAEAAPLGSERRRFKPRSSVTSACLVLESAASARPLEPAMKTALTRALLAALEARAFADAVATDRATGALNRLAFERAAAFELGLAGDASRPAALVLVEVALGSLAPLDFERADEVMAAAAVALRQALRVEDLLGRRGADELALLLVDAEPKSLNATLERLLARLGHSLAALGVDPPSLGAASFPDHGSSLDEIDAAARDALEGARAKGHGGVKSFDPALGRSGTSCRKGFLTGDPGLDAARARLLFETVGSADSARDPEEALAAVTRALAAATGAERAIVLRGAASSLEPWAAADGEGNPLPLPLTFSRNTCLRALALGRAVQTADAESPADAGVDSRLRSAIAVPLIGRDGPIGALYADDRRQPRPLVSEDLAYLEALAGHAVLALENVGLRSRLEEENAALRRAVRSGADPTLLLGSSAAFRGCLERLPEIVDRPLPVLIRGEAGTGRELLARRIHELGPRARGHFIARSTSELPPELLEDELFGHAAGPHPSSLRARRGLLELADGGTFFLAEIAALTPALQARLLRFLDTAAIERAGESRSRKVDVRIITSSAEVLERRVQGGGFSGELLERLSAFTIALPPLRERKEDVPELARHFVARAAKRLGRPQPVLAPEAIAALEALPWPGNIHELANVIEKAVSLARDGRIETTHVGLDAALPAGRGPLRATLAAVERDLVVDALRTEDGNVSAAARTLGIARQQLQRLMRKHRLRQGVKAAARP